MLLMNLSEHFRLLWIWFGVRASQSRVLFMDMTALKEQFTHFRGDAFLYLLDTFCKRGVWMFSPCLRGFSLGTPAVLATLNCPCMWVRVVVCSICLSRGERTGPGCTCFSPLGLWDRLQGRCKNKSLRFRMLCEMMAISTSSGFLKDLP